MAHDRAAGPAAPHMSRRRWSSRRAVAMVLTVVVWLTAGVGVYLYLSAHRSTFGQIARKPDEANLNARNSPLSHLSGTLYLVQAGTLYRLQQGTFTAVLNSPGGAAGWTQPAFLPHGQSLVVVRRDYAYSDLFDRPGRKGPESTDPQREPDRRVQPLGLLSAAVARWRLALLQLRPERPVQRLQRGLRRVVDADERRLRAGQEADLT